MRVDILRWSWNRRNRLKISKIIVSNSVDEKNLFTDFLIRVQTKISKDLSIVIANILGLMRKSWSVEAIESDIRVAH